MLGLKLIQVKVDPGSASMHQWIDSLVSVGHQAGKWIKDVFRQLNPQNANWYCIRNSYISIQQNAFQTVADNILAHK